MELTIDNLISEIKLNKEKLGLRLYPHATIADISYFEKKMSIKLPHEIKFFYSFSNGLECDNDMFRIIPLGEILDNNKNYPNSHFINQKDFYIAELLIYSDTWAISLNEKFDGYVIYNVNVEPVILTSSFSEFLNVYLKKGVSEGLDNWR